jgi:aldehyde:ferredoxin oxidoreductase
MNDRKDAAGRGGLGAVMGSKRLKAIAAFGRKTPQVADPAKIRELTLAMNKNFYDLPLFNKALHDIGTGEHASMLGGNAVGNMPSYNFAVNAFEGTARITATTTMETYGVGMEACAACAVRCKKVVELGEPWHVNKRNGGPEYESLAALGSTCGVDNLEAICKANELANLYGMDTISLGVSIAFGMDCFENGLLSLTDTDGLELKFGNAEGMLRMVDMITHREGVGNILAEGVHRASQAIGKGSEALAVHVKGVEVPMHDPRVKQGMGVIYAVEAHGADHCAGLHDTLFTQEAAGFEPIRGMGATRPLPANDLSADKVANVKAVHLWALFRDSLVCCQFVPWTITQHVDIVRAVTGWSYTTYEALKLGERIATMGRLFNLREGLTAAQDTLPKRLFNPTRTGALSTGGIDQEQMQHAIQTFYGMMGWDTETGIPTPEKLTELRLAWAEADLAALRGA